MKGKFIKLIVTSNDEFRYHYTLKKDENFFKNFPFFCNDLGIDLDWFSDWSPRKPNDKKIKGLIKQRIDKSEYVSDKGFHIDIFYGKNNVGLIIITKKKKKLVETVEKYFRFEGEKLK